MEKKIPGTARTMQVTVTSSTVPPPERWIVPPHLIGLTCVLCNSPFKDGDTHGEVEIQADGLTQVLVCRVQKAPTLPDVDGEIVPP